MLIDNAKLQLLRTFVKSFKPIRYESGGFRYEMLANRYVLNAALQ